MKRRIWALLLVACVVVFAFLGLAAPAAHAAAASQGELVTAPVPGDPTAATSSDPRNSKPPVPDDGDKPADGVHGMNPGAPALCPLRLHGGFVGSGNASPDVFTSCKSRVFGDFLCVTCCTCVVFADGELDCQCSTDCIQIF